MVHEIDLKMVLVDVTATPTLLLYLGFSVAITWLGISSLIAIIEKHTKNT